MTGLVKPFYWMPLLNGYNVLKLKLSNEFNSCVEIVITILGFIATSRHNALKSHGILCSGIELEN